MKKPVINEVLTSAAITALGTTALISMHHVYRKQQQPNARLQDYLTDSIAQAKSLMTAQFATESVLSPVCSSVSHCDYPDFSANHTTTMLPRAVSWVSGVASMPHHIGTDSAYDKDNDNSSNQSGFGVVGIDADRQLVWQTTMPERVHDIVIQPAAINKHNNKNQPATQRHVVVMGRRPSAHLWVLDTATGQVRFAIKANKNRHFYGHACYSTDGQTLYVTENDTVSLNGKIGIYDATTGYQKIAEFDSHGIGPHELLMHPDTETLIIANGGIKTEQASREELNLDSMRPSLVYLNRHDGTLLEQVVPEHNQMSVRHLDVHDNGMVMIGIQFQGEKHMNVPLVLTHQRGEKDFTPLLMPEGQWQRFHQYIASVAVDSMHNLLCVTTPIGGCAAIFNLTTRTLVDTVSLPDCAGASSDSDVKKASSHFVNEHGSFIVSDGQGQLTRLWSPDLITTATDIISHKMSFDNHLQAL